jgi:hypothetical protein
MFLRPTGAQAHGQTMMRCGIRRTGNKNGTRDRKLKAYQDRRFARGRAEADPAPSHQKRLRRNDTVTVGGRPGPPSAVASET